MVFQRIDLIGVASERFKIKIEGVDYFLRVYYLPRVSSFYLALDDQFEVPIQQGVRMVTGYPLLASNRDARKAFSGDIFALRFSGDGSSTFDIDAIVDGTVRLYYADREQMLAGAPAQAAPDLTVTP
jgi:hypothetical protein